TFITISEKKEVLNPEPCPYSDIETGEGVLLQNKSLFFASLIVLGLILFAIQNQLFNFFPASSWSLPLSGKIIYLDPGHGGPDGGAEHGEAVEKDIALNIAVKLRD